MKKALKSLLLSIPLLFGNPSQADDIYVTPQDDWYEILQSLEGTEENPTNVLLSEGQYENFIHRNDRLRLNEFVNLEGVIGIDDLYVSERDWIPTTFSSTVINNALTLSGDNRVSKVIFEQDFPNTDLLAMGTRFNISDCYFIGIDQAIVLYPSDGENTILGNNVFYKCFSGLINSLGSTEYSPDSKIRNNKFLDCDIGIYTQWGLDIGTEAERGNNIMMSKTNIRNDGLIPVPAQYNTWYGLRSIIEGKGNPDEYIFLDNETDIRKTIDDVLLNPQKSNYAVQVVPFNTQDYFATPLPTIQPTPTYSRTPTPFATEKPTPEIVPTPTETYRDGYGLFDYANNWGTLGYESSNLIKFLEERE